MSSKATRFSIPIFLNYAFLCRHEHKEFNEEKKNKKIFLFGPKKYKRGGPVFKSGFDYVKGKSERALHAEFNGCFSGFDCIKKIERETGIELDAETFCTFFYTKEWHHSKVKDQTTIYYYNHDTNPSKKTGIIDSFIEGPWTVDLKKVKDHYGENSSVSFALFYYNFELIKEIMEYEDIKKSMKKIISKENKTSDFYELISEFSMYFYEKKMKEKEIRILPSEENEQKYRKDLQFYKEKLKQEMQSYDFENAKRKAGISIKAKIDEFDESKTKKEKLWAEWKSRLNQEFANFAFNVEIYWYRRFLFETQWSGYEIYYEIAKNLPQKYWQDTETAKILLLTEKFYFDVSPEALRALNVVRKFDV